MWVMLVNDDNEPIGSEWVDYAYNYDQEPPSNYDHLPPELYDHELANDDPACVYCGVIDEDELMLTSCPA